MFKETNLVKLFKQFVQFGLVGVINTTVSFIIYEVFAILLNIDYLVSNIVSYVVGAVISFTLNKIWTFGSKEPVKKEAIVFLSVFIPCLALQNVFLILCKENLGLGKTISYILATGFYMIINFFGHKYITFRNA
jgi:putative flippase GtrA